MAGEIFRISGSLPQGKRPQEELHLWGERGAARLPRVVDGMEIRVWGEPDGETIWIQMIGGIGGVDLWYGPGDVRDARVQALVDGLLKR